MLTHANGGRDRRQGPERDGRYLHNPEATAAAIRDGWLHTGDVGYVDPTATSSSLTATRT